MFFFHEFLTFTITFTVTFSLFLHEKKKLFEKCVKILFGKSESSTDAFNVFQCPLCFERPSPKAGIKTCPKDHVICDKCYASAPRNGEQYRCYYCCGFVNRTEHVLLNELLKKEPRACAHVEYGCTYPMLPPDDIEEHERMCQYRPVKCPITGSDCPWIGRASQYC